MNEKNRNEVPLIKVVTSARSRFHIFDQARELNSNNALYKLITDYPAIYCTKFGIPKKKVRSLTCTGLLFWLLLKFSKFVSKKNRNQIIEWIHNFFSKGLKYYIPNDTEYFIGLSSFCLEALEFCKSKNILCAVDHGSIHQNDERNLLINEAKKWNVRIPEDTTPSWVIAKENKEYEAANHVFVLSSFARDSLVRNGVDPQKIFINPVGVDLKAFFPGEKSDDVFRVIQVGAISLGKGVLNLMEAFKKANIPNSELWFIGGGLENHGIKEKIEELKNEKIIFHGPVEQNDLQKYYSQSSVFVLASIADGFAMVVPQAMACGLPVIVTENVGAKDLIKNGENGIIVPASSIEALSEKLIQLANDVQLCKSIGLKAKDSVKYYDWNSYGRRLTSFIKTQVNS